MNLRMSTLSVVLIGLLASACSGTDAKPKSLPSVASASPTATASPASIPREAAVQTAQGADKFVRFYFDQMNTAFSTSDPGLVRAYSQGRCRTCEIYARALEASRAAGHHIQGKSFLVSEVAAAPVERLGTLVEVFGTIPPKRQIDRNGQTIDEIKKASNFHFTVAVMKSSPGWLVSGIRVEAS